MSLHNASTRLMGEPRLRAIN